MKINTILKKLYILQEVSNRGRNPRLGKGFDKAYRLNVWNPLSYILIITTIVVALFMFGFVGIRKQIDLRNPFKWI